MWPFTKKRKNEPESAWDGPWAVMQGQRDEDLLIARVNQGARRWWAIRGWCSA